MSIVPDDEMLLQEIRRIQRYQGPEIGIEKIWDYIKAEHPLWSFGLKRLRQIWKKNNISPSPNPDTLSATTTAPSPTTASSGGMLKLHLNIKVAGAWGGREDFNLKEDIPAALCVKGASQKDTSEFLMELIERREAELLKKHRWVCLYCGKPAEACFGLPAVTLHANPPTVFNLTQPLCSMRSNCAREAYVRLQSGFDNPEMGDAQVYTVPH